MNQLRPLMSGNGGNPQSLQDLLGTYEKSRLEHSNGSKVGQAMKGPG